MPELPEVETLVRQLAPLAKGRHVRQFEIIDTKLSVERPDSIHDMRIVSVMRLGKQIVIGLADPGRRAKRRWLAVHLRMTGRLIWSKAPETNPPRKLRARLRLDRGYLLFQDTRRFGTMRLADTIEAFAPAGLDPMSSQFNARALAERLAGARQSIKSWLLRQDRLAGLGNIYACEALHAARLSPWRPAGSLTRAETRRLAAAIRRELATSIAHRGTTISDFQDARGETGNHRRWLSVYGRAGKPCPRCGASIRRILQTGRATYFCPRCQPDQSGSRDR